MKIDFKSYRTWEIIIISIIAVVILLIAIPFDELTNKSGEKNNISSPSDYSWIVGEWRLKTQTWFVTIEFDSNGTYIKKEGPLTSPKFSVQEGIYYVEGNRIIFQHDGKYSDLIIQDGHRISNGNDYFIKQ